MPLPALVRAGTLAAALLLATTGCSSHKSASKAPAGVSPARPAAATRAATPVATPAPAGTTRGAIPGTKTCPTGDTAGVIAGKNKCLAAGQQCSAKNAADYPQYGFVCSPNGAPSILKKKP